MEPFSPPPTRRRRGVASRIVSAQVATIGAILATAIALVVYFAIR